MRLGDDASGPVTDVESARTFLFIIGERLALHWVVHHASVAFPPGRLKQAQRLNEGDVLLLYTSRNAFHNATRDRGRIVARARVVRSVQRFDQPHRLIDLTLGSGCPIAIEALAPYREGLELAPLVERMSSTFPRAKTWAAKLRTTLLQVAPDDVPLLERELAGWLKEPSRTISSYPLPSVVPTPPGNDGAADGPSPQER